MFNVELCPHCNHPVHSHSQYSCTIANCTCRVSQEDARNANTLAKITELANAQQYLLHRVEMLTSTVATLSATVERLLSALRSGIDEEEDGAHDKTR